MLMMKSEIHPIATTGLPIYIVNEMTGPVCLIFVAFLILE